MSLKPVFFGPRGLRSGWRPLIFNIAFMSVGILMKARLAPVVGRDPEWTAPNFDRPGPKRAQDDRRRRVIR